MTFLSIEPQHVTPLRGRAGLPERYHEFDEGSLSAVNAALAAQRPLLVRGETGVRQNAIGRGGGDGAAAGILFVYGGCPHGISPFALAL